MLAIELQSFSYNGLVAVDRSQPSMRDYDVKIRVLGVSLNYRDHLLISGLYGRPETALGIATKRDDSVIFR